MNIEEKKIVNRVKNILDCISESANDRDLNLSDGYEEYLTIESNASMAKEALKELDKLK